ncbi:MAG TPA: hypothetical protein DCY20_10760 [Firmicutes bacterium]|nr:hypothetical protein [Bacillota bacterium]
MKRLITIVSVIGLLMSPFSSFAAVYAQAVSQGQTDLVVEGVETDTSDEKTNIDEQIEDEVESSIPSNEEEVDDSESLQDDMTDSEFSEDEEVLEEPLDDVEQDVVDEDTNIEDDNIVEQDTNEDIIVEDEEVLEEDTSDLDSDESTLEDEEADAPTIVVSSPNKGKIEFDLYFAQPVVSLRGMELRLQQNGTEVLAFSLEEASKTSNVSVELLNSKREPLVDGSIYFAHITLHELELGEYDARIEAQGYQVASVNDINLNDYSKRVKFSTSTASVKTVAKMNEEYPTLFVAGDVNQDGAVNELDYDLVFENLNSNDLAFDLNRDGNVDVADLAIVLSNEGVSANGFNVENTDPIINVESVDIQANASLGEGQSLGHLITGEKTAVKLEADSTIGEETPLTIALDFGRLNKLNNGSDTITMESVVIKLPEVVSEDAGVPERGFLTYYDEQGVAHKVEFSGVTRSSSNEIVIDLGSQVAVKKIDINVTGNRGNKNIVEIAKVEFLNNVYTELPKPQMSIPVIKSLVTSTDLHDERMTISWDAEPNVTSYEVTYQLLNENGQVQKTKRLQTNETSLNILDKDIKAYSLWRVSIQSLNGDWQSGYLGQADLPLAFDGKADNVDANFNPIEEYYAGNIGSVTEIQVIPNSSPGKPINLVTKPGYKSFTVSWENHIQARDFDIYYRKVSDSNKKWIKVNQNRIEVDETSLEVTNPDKQYLVRAGSYVVNGLEDNTTYEVRVTATNHLGTSKMSDTYLASTETLTPPVMSAYHLINRPTLDNEIGTEHIIKVTNKNDPKEEGGWGNDTALTYDSKYSLVDGDFGTSWKVRDWDTGSAYNSNRGSIIEFDQSYKIGAISFAQSLEQGYKHSVTEAKITYWTEDGVQHVVRKTGLNRNVSNTHNVYTIYLDEPIEAKKIKVDVAGYGGSYQSMSELRYYEYDSLEDDVKALFTDVLRIQLVEGVTQEMIDSLVERANTPDEISGDEHPKKATILKELELANSLLNDQQVSENIVILDATLRDSGSALGMTNAWQSLGAVARPGTTDSNMSKTISVYMGSTDPNTQVEITFLQAYGQPGQYLGGTTIIKPGRTEIVIPQIISADVEKGGVVMAKVKSGSTDATIQIRLSQTTEIPHLNVQHLINDETKVSEVKVLIETYITQLKTYVNELPSQYPSQVTDADKLNNIYVYNEKTSVLNSTDIEGDRFTLTLPATQVLAGIESGLSTMEQKVERVYEALLAWEQEMLVTYAKKGVFESVQDFNGNGTIDSEDTAYYNQHKAPTTRMNIKYQRMIMGAAGYASSHHVGIEIESVAGLLQGVPFKFDVNGNMTNATSAKLYGKLIGHEIGHVVDIANRTYPETSNNLLPALRMTMQNQDSPLTSGAMTELYRKVTANTYGLSTNRSVVLGMLWQPHLAYEDHSTYEMLLTNFDGNLTDDSYYAKLNRAYREMSNEEKQNGDRDQWLIRLSSKVVGKDLSDFYLAHGIVPNVTTLQYVSQFEKETRPIQYINDEARRRRLEGTADMSSDTQLVAAFANGIADGAYVNQTTVPLELSVTTGQENILGYEIIRNGKPSAFVLRDKANEMTEFEDVISGGNNRTYSYEVVAYDYNLNATNKVSLGTVKVRHDGAISGQGFDITSSTIDIIEENNDIHELVANPRLSNITDGNVSTIYEGRKLTNDEYNALNPSNTELKPNVTPYVQLDLKSVKPIIGLKYTAPVTEGVFKNSIANNAIKKYRIEVSVDGVAWTRTNEGSFKLDANNPTEMIYFGKDGVQSETQLNTYQVRYVRLSVLDSKAFSIAELELVGPPGDNIEIGVSDDNVTYENGIGILTEDFIFQEDQSDTEESEEMKIPKGSVVITGEYSGNPAFNVPLVLNENEEHIADEYHGILMAEIPSDGNLEEISEGTWIYWVEPEFVEQFMENELIFAELYRTDTANLAAGGQRLVSNTFKVTIPEQLPEISFSNNKAMMNKVTTQITSEQLKAVQK